MAICSSKLNKINETSGGRVKKSKKMAQSPIAIVMGIVIVLGFAAVIGYEAKTRTQTSIFRISFDHMPKDDSALTDWLRSQPGVREPKVSRNGDMLTVEFIMPAYSTVPDVTQATKQFGYPEFTDMKTETNMQPFFH
jgi:hypothetical protein